MTSLRVFSREFFMSDSFKWNISKQKVLSALKKSGGSVKGAAKALGVPRTTLSSMVERLDIKPTRTKLVPTVEDSIVQNDLDFLNTQVKSLQKQQASLGSIRREIFKLADADPSPPDWTIKDRSTHKKRQLIPILLTSDFQWGEKIVKAEMDGINEYNPAIAKSRYRELITATIDISNNYLSQGSYPGIVYLRGGDTISGDIHEELKLTNSLTSVMQVYDVVNEEARGIELLADNFGQVMVGSVSGNHGRTTIKPMSKSYSETNYDYLVSLFLEKFFRHDKRVKFFTPISGDFYFKVYGHRGLLTHGDRIGSSGGQGFIGPAATILRGVKKTRDEYQSLGKPVDTVYLGHFHTAMHLTHCVANGSLPGYSEYARRFRMPPEPPSQSLIYIDPKFGIDHIRQIKLGVSENVDKNESWFVANQTCDGEKAA
jgi:hypothetical protein